MKEMLRNFYRKRLNYSATVLWVFSPILIQAQHYLNLESDKTRANEAIEISWSLDPISRREKIQELTLENGRKTIALKEINPCQSIRIQYRNTIYDLLLEPKKDTISLQFDDKQASWINQGAEDAFSQAIQGIDACVERAIFQNVKPGSPGAINRGMYLADSLRKTYTEGSNCLNDYAHFSAAFIELSSGAQVNQQFIEQVFKNRTGAVMNPAFSSVFHNLFDGIMFSKNRKNEVENWTEINQKGNDVVGAFKDWVVRNTLLENDTIIQWVILNSIQELINSDKIKKTELLNFLTIFGKEFTDSLMINLSSYLKTKIQYATRGYDFPDFQFKSLSTGKYTRLSELKGKPLYIIYLPSDKKEYLQDLFYLNSFQKKYSRDFNFIALIDRSSPEAVESLIKKYNFNFSLALFDQCIDFPSDYLESLTVPSYLLLNRKGQIWQSPAESPETGVESSFLGIIKQ